jgi:hypothetical protein
MQVPDARNPPVLVLREHSAASDARNSYDERLRFYRAFIRKAMLDPALVSMQASKSSGNISDDTRA